MSVKPYFTVADCAALLQQDRQTTYRWLDRNGALVALPGFLRRCHVPSSRMQELWPDAYEQAEIDSRYWESECAHSAEHVEQFHDRLWCSECGAVYVNDDWRLPSKSSK